MKKNLDPNSFPTFQDKKFQKKNSKKILKIKKVNSDIISIQNGLRETEKEKKKKFSPELRSYSTRARKLRKEYQKNSKN